MLLLLQMGAAGWSNNLTEKLERMLLLQYNDWMHRVLPPVAQDLPVARRFGSSSLRPLGDHEHCFNRGAARNNCS
jgi:hypothetical protein